MNITEVGDHGLILGEVLAMYVDSDKIDEKERILTDKLDGFLYAGWEYYKFGEKLGHLGFSRNLKHPQ